MPTLSITDYWRAFLISSLISEFPEAASLTMADLEHRYYTNLCGLPYPPNLSISDLKYASSTAGIANPEQGLDLLIREANLFADARNYSGSGPLTNGGISGSPLDLQLGTTASADTNDPTYLAVEDEPYVYMPGGGTGNNWIESKFSAGLTSPQELDFRALIKTDTGIVDGTWLGLFGQAGDANHYWQIQMFTTGGGFAPYLVFYSNAVRLAPGATAIFPQGVKLWIRVTRSAASGVVRFYTSPNETSWTQLGPDIQDAAGLIDFADSGQFFGRIWDAGFDWLGKMYKMKIYTEGVKRFDWSAADMSQTGNSAFKFQRQAAQRKLVLIQSRPCFLLGADDRFMISGANAAGVDVPASQPFTCLSYWRRWGPKTADYTTVFQKVNAPGPAGGYALYLDVGNVNLFGRLYSTGVVASPYFGGLANGTIELAGLMRSGSGQAIGLNYSGIAAAAETYQGSLSNAQPFLIGCESSGGQTIDAEFYGIAFFQRELTQEEIRDVSAYYGVTIP